MGAGHIGGDRMEQKKREIVGLVETMRADTVWIVWRFIQNLTK